MFLHVIARASLVSRQPQAPTPRVVTLPARTCLHPSEPPEAPRRPRAALGEPHCGTHSILRYPLGIHIDQNEQYCAFTRGHSHTKSTWVPLPPRHSWALLGCRAGAPPHLPPGESPRDLARLRLLARGRPPPQARPREHAQISLGIRKRMRHVTSCRAPTVAQTEYPTKPSTVCCARRLTTASGATTDLPRSGTFRRERNSPPTRVRRGGCVEPTTNNGRWACTCNRPAPSFCSVERGLAGVVRAAGARYPAHASRRDLRRRRRPQLPQPTESARREVRRRPGRVCGRGRDRARSSAP